MLDVAPQYVRMALSGRSIAIVDDDPSVLKALRRALRARGLDASAYGSAQEFIESLPGGIPECLIVDLQMPSMTGLELHHHLRNRSIRIPTIIITAHSDIRMRERPESAGISAVLLKPLESASVFAAIAAAIGPAGSGENGPPAP